MKMYEETKEMPQESQLFVKEKILDTVSQAKTDLLNRKKSQEGCISTQYQLQQQSSSPQLQCRQPYSHSSISASAHLPPSSSYYKSDNIDIPVHQSVQHSFSSSVSTSIPPPLSSYRKTVEQVETDLLDIRSSQEKCIPTQYQLQQPHSLNPQSQAQCRQLHSSTSAFARLPSSPSHCKSDNIDIVPVHQSLQHSFSSSVSTSVPPLISNRETVEQVVTDLLDVQSSQEKCIPTQYQLQQPHFLNPQSQAQYRQPYLQSFTSASAHLPPSPSYYKSDNIDIPVHQSLQHSFSSSVSTSIPSLSSYCKTVEQVETDLLDIQSSQEKCIPTQYQLQQPHSLNPQFQAQYRQLHSSTSAFAHLSSSPSHCKSDNSNIPAHQPL